MFTTERNRTRVKHEIARRHEGIEIFAFMFIDFMTSVKNVDPTESVDEN